MGDSHVNYAIAGSNSVPATVGRSEEAGVGGASWENGYLYSLGRGMETFWETKNEEVAR